MKVLLFSEGMNLIKISGLGRAIMHQQRAMELNGIEYTLDPKDSYDVVHINTLGLKSKHLAKKAKKAGKRVVYHAHSTQEAFRKKFGLKDDDKVVISVGLYFERKGLLDFVQMAKDMPDYKFIWFGKTPLYSVPHKIRKAVKTKLPNLTFAGYVQPDELKQAYVGCDVYIFPTLEETEGIVLLEALAAKANVIVRDIPVFDWLNGGTDCYKAKDKDEFERMIKEIYEGKLPSLRENGRKAVENMDIKKIGEKLVKIYNGTAEGGD